MIRFTPAGIVVSLDLIDEDGARISVSLPLPEFVALSQGRDVDEQRIALLTWKDLQAAA